MVIRKRTVLGFIQMISGLSRGAGELWIPPQLHGEQLALFS